MKRRTFLHLLGLSGAVAANMDLAAPAKTAVIAEKVAPKAETVSDLISYIESKYSVVDSTYIRIRNSGRMALLSFAPTGEPFVQIGWHPTGLKQARAGVLDDLFISDCYEKVTAETPCEIHGGNPYRHFGMLCSKTSYRFQYKAGASLSHRAPILSYHSEAEAVQAALSAFDAYAAKRRGRLYWMYPEKASLVWWNDDLMDDNNPAVLKMEGSLRPDDPHGCRIELRLIISDKEEKRNAESE